MKNLVFIDKKEINGVGLSEKKEIKDLEFWAR